MTKRCISVSVFAAAMALGTSACGASDQPSGDGSATSTVTVTESPTSSPSSSSPSPSSSTSLSPCRTTGLKVTLTDSEGAAGSTYSQLTLTNTGTSACVTGGYGGVSYAGGEAGAQIGAPADREKGAEGSTGQQITLQPGQSAKARLREVAAGNFDASKCKPTKVYALKVYPPNETEATFVKRATTGCANTAVHLLSLQPYVKG